MIYRFAICFAFVTTLLCGCTAYDVDTPDTAANRKGFERHLMLAPTDAVSQVYYYADEMGADVRYQLSFKCDKTTIDQIVTGLSLSQAPAEYNGLAPRDDLKWWKSDSIKGRTLWVRERTDEYYWELWYSENDSVAYYHEYSI
ncbi:MAG: hypothetical protein KAR44_08685 [Candidatus Aegiribacteria sp.]|nr:hypothetical protein [Candidatus Aegiribacteria sp.]